MVRMSINLFTRHIGGGALLAFIIMFVRNYEIMSVDSMSVQITKDKVETCVLLQYEFTGMYIQVEYYCRILPYPPI